ncbi:hypothetical protein GCM10011344_25760 [Dokdonia pacifica]|uniref:DUF6268 domain-containing protein n=1 Tax=Dokdonia pacifica TaxID=1627892 RepID=A0A238WST7_9FLAO|nr:DUF6268 family outer membrane beta-barrel protein [Dokdonia pacifica]GGG23821.1 hypothetical protein GCM10011344_25760 [Dokdonia pacifica]SNR49451.1 hypothetical protein SAMN06265376_1011433 [Dokdonia pacifica]
MPKQFKNASFIFLLISSFTYAQLSDLARIEYIGLPEGSDNGSSFNRFRALVNFPIELKEDTYLFVGLDYSYIDYNVDESLVSFDPREIDEFQLFDLNIGYTFKLNEDWRFGARIQPGFSSNLKARNLSFEDAILSGDAVFIKDKKDNDIPYRLILGVSVSGKGGFPILPFISYYRKFHPKWSYNVGVPKINLQYHASSKHRFKLVARLDGFRANLQRGIEVGENQEIARRFRQQLVVGGLRYEYKFTDHIEYYINSSYILSNSVEFRDRSRNTLAEISEDNNLYIKTGIRFKL